MRPNVPLNSDPRAKRKEKKTLKKKIRYGKKIEEKNG